MYKTLRHLISTHQVLPIYGVKVCKLPFFTHTLVLYESKVKKIFNPLNYPTYSLRDKIGRRDFARENLALPVLLK